MGVTNPIVTNGYEFDAIAATTIGGTDFSGGESSIGSHWLNCFHREDWEEFPTSMVQLFS